MFQVNIFIFCGVIRNFSNNEVVGGVAVVGLVIRGVVLVDMVVGGVVVGVVVGYVVVGGVALVGVGAYQVIIFIFCGVIRVSGMNC